MQTRERVTKIINVGIIVQQEVLVNYLIGEDALEIGNFERAKILGLLEFREKMDQIYSLNYSYTLEIASKHTKYAWNIVTML